MGGLVYNSIPFLGLSLQSSIKFIQRILWWYLSQQYINRKKFLLFLLHYHIFPHPLQHLPTQYWYAWRTVPGNAAVVQGEAIALSLFGRGSRGLSCGACSSESKKRDRGQSKGRSQKTEACRRKEKEEKVGVHSMTLEQSDSREHHLFGGHWEIPDHKI